MSNRISRLLCTTRRSSTQAQSPNLRSSYLFSHSRGRYLSQHRLSEQLLLALGRTEDVALFREEWFANQGGLTVRAAEAVIVCVPVVFVMAQSGYASSDLHPAARTHLNQKQNNRRSFKLKNKNKKEIPPKQVSVTNEVMTMTPGWPERGNNHILIYLGCLSISIYPYVYFFYLKNTEIKA